MAVTVRLDVEELVLGPDLNEPRSITLGPGDEVPEWALTICSDPRKMDGLEDED